VQAVPAGGRAVFFVTDHGPGIAAEDRDRVFERFVQLDQSTTRRRGGLGLGLYLCRELSEMLGGELVLTEAAGGGCCFTLSVAQRLDGRGADPTCTPDGEAEVSPWLAFPSVSRRADQVAANPLLGAAT
jgi:K+-sensing histidine kinase KdpD